LTDQSTLARPAVAAPIDPRIRARRIEVQRDAGRRRLQRLADVGIVLAVVLAFVVALWSPLLDVDVVHVDGAVRSTDDAVRAAAGIAPGDGLVGVDLGAAGARVASLPWVEEVALRRQLDGTVSIDVMERIPVAQLAGPDGLVLVDRTGRVLGAAAEADAAASIQLTGLPAAPAPGHYLSDDAASALALVERLATAVPGAVATIDVQDLSGTLAQGGVVRLPARGPIGATATSLRTVLAQVDLTCLAVLDLRLPEHPVLTREEGCS
jgi:cell division protein FtsQ